MESLKQKFLEWSHQTTDINTPMVVIRLGLRTARGKYLVPLARLHPNDLIYPSFGCIFQSSIKIYRLVTFALGSYVPGEVLQGVISSGTPQVINEALMEQNVSDMNVGMAI